MPIRSHVDPTMFVPFIHIQGTALTSDLGAVVAALNLRHGDSFSPILNQLHARTHQLVFHETYHFWQGLRLPFMFRYALLSYRLAMQAFASLSRNSANISDWACELPQFERLNLPSELGLSPNGKVLFGGSIRTARPAPLQIVQITPLLLLETAATLAEYNVTASGKRTDQTVFQRWCKKNPGYISIIGACAKFLCSEELTLRCLLPLINACFHTSIPERAFALLLARTWGVFARSGEFSEKFLAQQEPCRWTELYEMWLSDLDYEAESSVAEVLDNAFYRLHLADWVNGGYGGKDGLTHPFLGPAARLWLRSAASDESLLSVMDFPGFANEHTFALCMTEMQPPVSVYRFHLSSGNDHVVLHGDTAGKAFLGTTPLDASQYRGFIADTLTMYGAVRAASGAHFDADQRTCHHEKCPLYAQNLCNAYPIVPASFEQCGFTARVDRFINLWRSS
jgi:hypothetical protein